MDDQAVSAAPPALRKRARFQLHLSTCVVLMLAAGILLWANVRERVRESGDVEVSFRQSGLEGHKTTAEDRGWPATLVTASYERVYECRLKYQPDPRQSVLPIEEIPGTSKFNAPSVAWNALYCIVDLFCAIGIFASVGFGCEWLLRRRRRKSTAR